MACVGNCTLCCCCGVGELVELPDYYCRFVPVLPGTGNEWSGSRCADTTRQKLNWLLTDINLDATNMSVDLQSPFINTNCSECLSLLKDEDTNCWVTYEDLFPYGYSFAYTNDTHWTIVEESECFGTKYFPGQGLADYCFRRQTQVRVQYGLKNMKVNIARCKIPNAACDSEVSLMDEGDCGYLVTATMDVVYKVYIWSVFIDGRIQSPTGANQCRNVGPFPEPHPDSYEPVSDPLLGITVNTYTECITRSKVVSTLKGDPADPDRIYIEFVRVLSGQDVDCCNAWESPNLKNQGFPEGKPEGENEVLFRCSCDSELSLLIEGECTLLDCVSTDPGATYTCNTSQLQIDFMAGNKWFLSW